MKIRKFIIKRLPCRRQIRKNFIYRVFGKYILARHLWHINRRSLAGGLSIGLFLALTPTIPFQMLLTCVGALYFRVNLPVGLAACWVTNPLTAMPIYLTAWRIGRKVLASLPFMSDLVVLYSSGSRAGTFMMHSLHLWTGSLILASLTALVSNVLVRLLWREEQS